MMQNSSALLDSSLGVNWRSTRSRLRPANRYGSAWGISCIAHVLLLGVALWGGTQVVEAPRPPIRLVFVEPPPPPPAPASAPVATETAPTVERPSTVEKKPQPQTPPKRKEPERPKVVKAKIIQELPKQLPPKPTTSPEPEPVAEPTPPTEAAPVESANAASATTTDTKGVVGGVAGGHVGGVIGSHGTEPLPVNQVANPPLLLSRVTPDYPRQARRQGVEGLVVLEAILNLEGQIEDDIKVLQSVPLLDDAAVQALRRWRFRPARDHTNQPVRVILEVPVRFVLR